MYKKKQYIQVSAPSALLASNGGLGVQPPKIKGDELLYIKGNLHLNVINHKKLNQNKSNSNNKYCFQCLLCIKNWKKKLKSLHSMYSLSFMKKKTVWKLLMAQFLQFSEHWMPNLLMSHIDQKAGQDHPCFTAPLLIPLQPIFD